MEPWKPSAGSDPRRVIVLDALLAAALTAFVWLQLALPRLLFSRAGGPRLGPPGVRLEFHLPPRAPWAAYLIVAVALLPLALRRRHPVGVLLAAGAATAAYELLHLPPSMIVLSVLVALYTAGTVLDRRRLALWGGVSAAVVLAASLPTWSDPMFGAELARTLSVMVAAAVLGDATRNRRAYVAEVEQRALEAERTREEEARRRVDEERLRIARELHDITAHSLSIVAVQSGAALHVLDDDPGEARKALVAIRETSRASLHELRAVLGVLRGPGEGDEAAPLTPTPGLASLEHLVRPLRDTGLDVETELESGGGALPAMVDASAFRIIQEALTNVLRHAGTARVRVTVTRRGDLLHIEVVDDGTSASEPAGEGHGITGMRERALALGGTFEAGPSDTGGWRVAAALPVGGRSA